MTGVNKTELEGKFAEIGEFVGDTFRHPEIPFSKNQGDNRDRFLATGTILLKENTIPVHNIRTRHQFLGNARIIYVVREKGPKGKRDRFVGIVRDERFKS